MSKAFIPSTTLRYFRQFKEAIRELPGGWIDGMQLRKDFRIAKEGELELCFAPLGWVDPKASLIIVGITPGLRQAQIAFRYAHRELHRGKSYQEILGGDDDISFAGAMRNNLCNMLAELGIHRCLRLKNTAELFMPGATFLHATSAIRFPVLDGGTNYKGKDPSIVKSPLLRRFLESNLTAELSAIPRALIVPLGKAVGEALNHLVHTGRLDGDRILNGFPHPSPQNRNQAQYFVEAKSSMQKRVSRWRRSLK